jgi:hypothetical protein
MGHCDAVATAVKLVLCSSSLDVAAPVTASGNADGYSAASTLLRCHLQPVCLNAVPSVALLHAGCEESTQEFSVYKHFLA